MAKSVTVPADIRSNRRWKGIGEFEPVGEPKFAYRNNPYLTPNSWSSNTPIWSARIFVGFNVGEHPRWKMADLIRLVKQVRREQKESVDSTFIYQRGVYTHEDGTVVTEDGAQAIILNLDEGKGMKVFRDEMIELAETIRTQLEQETVILELQRGGVTKQTLGIDADGF